MPAGREQQRQRHRGLKGPGEPGRLPAAELASAPPPAGAEHHPASDSGACDLQQEQNRPETSLSAAPHERWGDTGECAEPPAPCPGFAPGSDAGERQAARFTEIYGRGQRGPPPPLPGWTQSISE